MKRKGDWIQTYTGIAYWPLDPRPEEVHLEDIAQALANLCRFTGHTTRFYSVAEHSVHVSHLVPQEFAIVGLLHDAAEAYINDLNRPVKYQLPSYREVEDLNWRVIAERFNLPLVIPKPVKDADGVMLWTERRALFTKPAPIAWGMGIPEPDPYPELGHFGLSPEGARQCFMARWKELAC